MLLSNIKIHEIAKKLNLNSKEVLERAQKLGFDVKSHLSGVTDEIAKKIEESFNSKHMNKSVPKKAENKKEKNDRSCNYKKRSNYSRRRCKGRKKGF